MENVTKEAWMALKDELTEMREKRAVLVEAEEIKKKEREELQSKLKEAGVDINNLDAEKERLQDKIKTEYGKQVIQLGEFKRLLNDNVTQLDPVDSGFEEM